MPTQQPSEHSVPTPAGPLIVHHWGAASPQITFVAVHPWAPLGGGEHNVIGYARCLSSSIPGAAVLTFDMRSSSMIWGVLRNHRSEISQIIAVCSWAESQLRGQLVLLGSSAGAPVAGAALARTNAIGLVAIGYTFGGFSSIAFGRHYSPTLNCAKPKIFIQGSEDEFTKPATLEAKVARAQGSNSTHVFDRVGHFELEAPGWDAQICALVTEWMQTALQQPAAEGEH